MHRWATKDHFEREEEETERLVRKSPKDKPPRRDLRRERVDTDTDADSVDESDRKDRSKNYKTIGGSEWKLAAGNDRIPAKNRETGKTVYISPQTLKDEPGKYEVVDNEEGVEGEESYYARIGDALHGLAKENPKLKNKLKDFFNPESHIFGFLKQNPDYPVGKLFPGVDFPEGVHTLGDIQKALQNVGKELPKNPPKKQGPQPKPAEPSPEKAPENPPAAKDPSNSEETPKGEEPKSEESAPAEEEKPPVIPKVKRRAVTEVERLEAASLVADTFSPEDSAKILSYGDLHPDDIKVLVRDYLSAKEGRRIGDLSSFADKVSSFYSKDLGEIQPPGKGRDAKGDLVPLDKLSDEEKAEAILSNQLRVLALSFAAHDAIKTRLMDIGVLSGKPRIPEEVASKVTDAMLRPASEDLGSKSFDEFLQSGIDVKVSEKTAKSLLKKVEGNAGGSAVARSFLQANDYANAKSRFLRGDDETISEWQEPKDIVKGLGKVGKFFAERNAWYGAAGDHPAAGYFRLRVLQRLKALDPRKASQVTRILPDLEEEEYLAKVKAWAKEHEGWEELRARHQRELKEFTEPEPVKPQPPPKVPDKEMGKRLWKDIFKAQIGKKSSDSSYLFDHVMSSAEKTAVYHGVDPYAYGPADYPEWSQPHQRDMGSEAEREILASAKDWLKSPLLFGSIEGMVPDAKYRAALDLAIYSGPYNGQVQPTLYNKLLASLAGVGSEETLTTIREASSGYELTTQDLTVSGVGVSTEVVQKALSGIKLSYKGFEGSSHSDGFAKIRSVKASDQGLSLTLEFPKGSGAQLFQALQTSLSPLKIATESKFSDTPVESLRRFASRVGDDRVAFEMLTYAQSLSSAQNNKYATLKAQIVKHAASLSVAQRKSLIPILQALKDLG